MQICYHRMMKKSNDTSKQTKAVAARQADAGIRFEALAQKGSKQEGLALLDKLDEALGKRDK